MPIVRMTSREDFEANPNDPNYWIVSEYSGYEAGRIEHHRECPHYAEHNWKGIRGLERGPHLQPDCLTEGYQKRCSGPFEPLYMHASHVGLVLSHGEKNYHDDSDFYAVVWNRETQTSERITYATTRGWTYPNSCTVDATPDVIAEWEAFSERKREEHRVAEALKEERAVRKGKVVRVVRGRKVKVGTEGSVIWCGADNWGKPRIGIKDPQGTVHWTAEANVEVVASV